MNAPRYDHEFVKAALIDRAEDLFRDAWGEPERATGKEWRAKSSSARAMAMKGPDRGLWTDHRTGNGGDIFDLIAVEFCGLEKAKNDFPRVIREAVAWAGLSPDAKPDLSELHRKRAQREQDTKIAQAEEARDRATLIEMIQDRAQKVAGTPAEAYLNRRGVETLPETGLAYAPRLKPHKGLMHPGYDALIAWATDEAGKITGGQRVLIKADGSPAPEETRKPAFGSIQGHPARFRAKIKGGPLYVAEGPESALTIWAATGAETWAVFGSSGWKAAPLPLDRQIILCPDRDADGSPAQKAFAKAVALHIEDGRNIWIATAPEEPGSKCDLNDTIQRAGIEAVRDALDAAQDARPRPYHPAHEGDREAAIKAHRDVVRGFFDEALPLIRATKQAKAEIEALDPDAPDHRRQCQAIRRAARDAFGLDVLPAKQIGKAQKAPRVMLTGAQGVGKTRALIEALTGSDGITSLCLFPDHDKAAEACRDYIKAAGSSGPVALHLKGRSVQDAARPDRTMCLIPEAAEALAKRGVNVRGTLCERCPLADECGYLEQERELIRLADDPQGVAIFAPSEYAFLPLPGQVKPDLIAFDEAPKNQGAAITEITLDALGEGLTEGRARVSGRIGDASARADALADELALIRPAMVALRDAWQADPNGAEVYAKLIAEGWTAERFKEARAALSQFEAESIAQKVEVARLAAGWDGAAFERRVARIAEEKQERITKALGKVLDAVAHEIEAGIQEPVAVTFKEGQKGRANALEVSYLKTPAFPKTAPFMHLDGTGDHALAEAVFGPMHLEHHKVERNATITQVTGKSFSNQSIIGKTKLGELIGGNVEWQAPELRRDLIAFAHSKPTALVVANKSVIDALKDAGLQNKTAHFGKLRGQNTWEHLDAVIVIGREQPSPQKVERTARAFASRAGQTLQNIGGNYPRAERGLRMRQGLPVQIETAYHPNQWADRVLSQIRDAEALQAIDRIRPIFKANPVEVFVLSETCLDVTVDAVCSWAELREGGDRITRTISQAGFVPLSDREAVRLFPETWNCRRTAERDLYSLKVKVDEALQDTAQQVAHNANRISYLQNAPLIGATLIEYRTAPKEGRRTGNRMRALVWGPLPEARAKVEAVAGPLASFEIVPEWEAVADALDAAEERAAIIAESQFSTQYAHETPEAPETPAQGREIVPEALPPRRLERPPAPPEIVPFRHVAGRGAG